MAEPRHLSKPPIREALVDIRIASAPHASEERLKTLEQELKSRYPKPDHRRLSETTLTVRGGVPSVTTRDVGFHGLHLSASDRSAVVQFRPDGFTFNKLGGYTTADELIAEALDLWARYVHVAEPDYVVRLALRYINDFELPIKAGDDFDKFLTSPPVVPSRLPQHVSEFLTRIAFLGGEGGSEGIVTQRFQGGKPPAVPKILLDIDVFRSAKLPVQASELEPHLQTLRKLKNDAFFSLLQDEAVRLFE